MEDLTQLPNIGPDTERELKDAGICDAQTLRAVGSREAWLRIRRKDPGACLHRLLALEGAVRGVRKSALPDGVKEELRAFYKEQGKERV